MPRTTLKQCWLFLVAYSGANLFRLYSAKIWAWIDANAGRHSRTDCHAFKVAALGRRRTSSHHRFDDRISVLHQRVFFERELSNRNGNIAILVELELDPASLHLLYGFGCIFGDRSCSGIGHQPTRTENFAELADFGHCR